MVSTTGLLSSVTARPHSTLRTPYFPSYVERSKAVDHHREPSCPAMMADGADESTSQRKRIAVAVRRGRVLLDSCPLSLTLLSLGPFHISSRSEDETNADEKGRG